MPNVKLSPTFNDQAVKSTGVPASGYKIHTYSAGSSSPLAAYVDSTGTTPHPNPITLDANGFPQNGQIWLQAGLAYKLVLTDENDAVIKSKDNITGVNDPGSSTNSQWLAAGLIPSYVSASSFLLTGDQTTEFHAGRRVQASTTLGTVYGTIDSSTFNSGAGTTTVSLTMDGANVLDSGLSNVNLAVLRADYPSVPGGGGILVLPAYRDKRVEVICGALRQDSSDRTKWNFINDADHHPVGVSGAYATASGNNITINFTKTYGKVLAFVAVPDEYLASNKNITVGASVGLSSAVLNLGGSIALYREIYWNGSAWVTDTVPGAYSEGTVTTSYSNGLLTINHSYCPGLMAFAQPLPSSGTVSAMPFVSGGGNTSTGISWMSSAFATNTSATPSTSMRVRWTKQYHGPIHVDGTNGSDTLALHSGNIWFFAIMELP